MSTPDSSTDGLEALAGMAQQVDGANPSAEQQHEEQAKAAAASESDQAAMQWGMLMFTVGGFAQMIAPELKPVYTEENCFRWGQQANAVAQKYGWGSPSRMPELALLTSTAGFAVPTFFLIREKLREAKEGKGPQSWLNKFGLWWRTRKARQTGAAMADPKKAAEAMASDGSK